MPRFALLLALAAWTVQAAAAPEVTLKMRGETIDGPANPQLRAAWLAEMVRWREEQRAKLNYNGAEYERQELAWSQRSFIQPLVMVEERYLYDPVARKYTVDRYLDDLEKRYGGIDSVLLWPVYPNVGIDNRNQHDLLRDMPGGYPGVKLMVDGFHRRGVRVLFPVMPWEAGTRVETPLWEAAAQAMKSIGADGIFGDTMGGLPREFRSAADKAGHPLVLEPESQLQNDAMVAWNNMSWGSWNYQAVPVVSKYKWIEPRHMVHVCERWAKDRTNGMQSAFFNGVGYETWENVWGIWNQVAPRDAEALRRISAIYRAVPELLTSPGWEPHVPVLQPGIYASKFPGKDRTLWLLVNRGNSDAKGEQLEAPAQAGARYYDLWNGTELKPAPDGPSAKLAFEIEGRGYGAVLAVAAAQVPPEVERLLARMAELSRAKLASFSAEWKPLPQTIVEIAPTKPAKAAPEGMLAVPAGKFRFQVTGVEIEGGDPGVDVQYPWEDLPRKKHDKELEIKAFYIDRFPVTNADFKKFLDATKYRPEDDHNFLRDWKDGACPQGWEKKPVTWVSIEDARAYASWAGKRLPHEWEWQYAAQGTDGRLYPCGATPDPAAIPPQEDGHDLRPPTDVVGRVANPPYTVGASPFGVLDLVGNVWQWTDEYRDEHTRAAILRGGCWYRPKGSGWYFPRNNKLNEHAKYLLMAPSKDRAGTVGFRCVVDGE